MAPPILSKLRDLTSKIQSVLPPSQPCSSTLSARVVEQIQKLRELLSRIQATVVDAEERDVIEQSVKLRLLDLKQVAYDAENILNDFNYELLSDEVERKIEVNHQKRKFEVIDSIVSRFYDHSILLRIKKVVERFEEISQNWEVLSLSEVDGARKAPANTRYPSSSFINSTETFGRDVCKNHIINSMLHVDKFGTDNVKVISVLSMGGMGKTTLAKLVYNDEMVERHFDVRSWVWVSERFDEVAISRSILESIVKRPCDFIQLDCIQNELKESVREKRFFVVLDDIWNEDQSRWDAVLGPLVYGAKGSCILITTRNSNVAEVGRTELLIPLGGLHEDDSWALFCHYAFSEMHHSNLPHNLVAIGRKIVQKCNGVPLVLRTLGCLLAHETEEDTWEYIFHSDVWELEECKTSIIPILKLSYNLLPSHLKPCFTYCAAFPRGHVFNLENLVHLWLALGFIQKHPRRQLEEVGRMYARDLIQRSFFQTLSSITSTSKLTLHDLMHDLAQAISWEEIHVTANEQLNEVCRRKSLRHLTILVNKQQCISFGRCLDGLSLKSLIITGCNNANFLLEDNVFDNPCFANLCVLDLDCWASDEVPYSISNLKHLRYLGLSGQKLPESICDLYHLETLNLGKSKGQCQFKRTAVLWLPRKINRLINLRHLLVDPWDTLMMPKGIGNLTNLQSLPLLSLNHESATLRELKELNNLGGTLQIINLDHTMQEESLVANLKSKKHLNHLIVSFKKEISRLTANKYAPIEVLECLKPHTNIEQITLEYYEGEQLPSWFEDYSFCRLTNLKLQDCIECKQLPAIGQLPHLKHLRLESFNRLENVGNELLGDDTTAFPSLEVLVIYDMPILERWCYEEEREIIFPRLREVHLSLCHILSSFQLPTISPLDKVNVSWCDCLQIIHGLEGPWSIIKQWKSLLDSSRGQDDESLSILHNELNILDSRVLKLQKYSKAWEPLPTHPILTIVGCPLLQKSYLNKAKTTTEETFSLTGGDESGGFFRTIERSLRRKLPDFAISEEDLVTQLMSNTSTTLLGAVTNLRRFILHHHNSIFNNYDTNQRESFTTPLMDGATSTRPNQASMYSAYL